MVAVAEPAYILPHDESLKLITERRKIVDGTALRPCPLESCEGWLYPRDWYGATFEPIFIPTIAGEAKVVLEGRCDVCTNVWTWPLINRSRLA